MKTDEESIGLSSATIRGICGSLSLWPRKGSKIAKEGRVGGQFSALTEN
jgi:hypothetical protein